MRGNCPRRCRARGFDADRRAGLQHRARVDAHRNPGRRRRRRACGAESRAAGGGCQKWEGSGRRALGSSEVRMPTEQLHYGPMAKVFHWLIVALLAIQLPLGWLMPDIHRGMRPGIAMSLHVSIGMTILLLIVLRFVWRLTHPVAPETNLPPWQRVSSELVHWLLYVV